MTTKYKLAIEIHEQCQNGASVSDIIALLEASPAQEIEPVAWRYRYITGIEHDPWLYSSSIEHVELVIKNLGIDKDKFESEPLFTHPPADKDAERKKD